MAGDDDNKAVVPAPATDTYVGPRGVDNGLSPGQIDAHGLLSETGAVTAADVPAELEERWGHGALPGFKNYVAAATAALDWAGEGAEALNDAFNSLPESVQLAIVDQLAVAPASRSKLQPAADTYVHEFAQEDFGSFCCEVWGRKTASYRALVDKRIEHILSNLDAEDRDTLLDWFDSLHAQDAAAVYLALSGAK